MAELRIQAEQLENDRQIWLKLNLAGFCLWDGLRITDQYLWEGASHPLILLMQLAGWLAWMLSIIQLIRLGNILKKNKQLTQILNDELVKVTRLQSWKVGFIVILFMQVLLIALSFVKDIPVSLGAELTIFTGVAAAIGTFIFYRP